MKFKSSDDEVIRNLNSDPSRDNWVKLESWLPSSRARYYKIYFREGNISSEQDLLGSYAAIFDSKMRELGKLPIYEKEPDGGIKGALIHLRGLLRTG